jgi:hypothetical protein
MVPPRLWRAAIFSNELDASLFEGGAEGRLRAAFVAEVAALYQGEAA